MSWRIPVLIIAAIGVLFGLIFLHGTSPHEALTSLFNGSLGSASAISGTLKETTALLITGLAVFVALRAGLFNIGVEGQLLVGALSATVVGLRIPGPLGMTLALMVGVLVGALWALPAGWIRAYRNGHEVITTIMMNYIALSVTTALVAGPLRHPQVQSPTTAQISPGSVFPFLVVRPPLQINFALLVAILLVIGYVVWLKRTVAGYELRATGANARAAAVAGVDTKRVQLRSMLASGALAGLAGALHVFAYEYRFFADFSPGYGFDALGVALLASSGGLGLLPAALGFGILNKGSASLQILGIPKGITWVVLGLLIIVFAAVRYRKSQVAT